MPNVQVQVKRPCTLCMNAPKLFNRNSLLQEEGWFTRSLFLGQSINQDHVHLLMVSTMVITDVWGESSKWMRGNEGK